MGGWCGARGGVCGVIAGRRRSVYRLPSQQVPSSPLPPPACTFFLNSLRPGHTSPPPKKKTKKTGITSSAYTLKPKVHPLNPGCIMLCKRWRWVGQDGVGGQRQEECPPPPQPPPRPLYPPTCTLTSCTSACRKLFVHRHKASLSESCREKLTVVSLS